MVVDNTGCRDVPAGSPSIAFFLWRLARAERAGCSVSELRPPRRWPPRWPIPELEELEVVELGREAEFTEERRLTDADVGEEEDRDNEDDHEEEDGEEQEEEGQEGGGERRKGVFLACRLYTSDAADE